jgi:hypothetical protein
MAQKLYHSATSTLAAGPTTVTVVHGLNANGAAVIPDVAYCEWTSDPGANGRWWVSASDATSTTFSFDGNAGNETVKLHLWYWHSLMISR